MPIAISCKQLQKTYPTASQPVHALRGINLDIEEGEFLMLVGPSGCGKTTLISIVAGILEQSSGHCRIFDQDWHTLSASQRAQLRARNIGFVFQQFQLIPTLTIQQNAAVPLLILGESRKT
ncbi:MAG: ATP-binding cassette domain-containing protein, partial [Acidobacteria bacterium]|nr:ATP-binding cassette domain-containing protein [Acidobacteriota bacterium]